MIEERATVVDVRDGRVWLQVAPPVACGGCRGRASCDGGIIGRALGVRPRRVDFPDHWGASVGQEVVLRAKARQLLGAAARAYLLPTLLLLGAAFLGRLTAELYGPSGWEELFSAGAGALGLAIGVYWAARIHSGRLSDHSPGMWVEPVPAHAGADLRKDPAGVLPLDMPHPHSSMQQRLDAAENRETE